MLMPLSLSTAKVLFAVALALAPQGAHTIMATSSCKNYLWTQTAQGWTLETKRLPADDWETRGHQALPRRTRDVRDIEEHSWHHQSFLYLQDGNRVDEVSHAVCYTVEPGEANAETFTILYSENK